MLRTVWLTCVLTVASASAWAQSAPTVERAQTVERTAEQKLARLMTQRSVLVRQLQEQSDRGERLKREKPSWRRDRELNAAQAAAADTAKRLTALDVAIRAAQKEVAATRMAAVAAIDAELATAIGARADQLRRLRAQLAPPTAVAKKILIPDAEIDPLADPEELDRQAGAVATAEKQLLAQQQVLDDQAKQLRRNADLRSAHERAGELSTRDDDQPRRLSSTAAGREAATAQGTAGGAGEDSGQFNDHATATSQFEVSAVALGEAIDRTTIDGLVRASRSADPKQRADAAEAARDAVAKRLEQLRRKRAMIEQRAKQLRRK